MSCIVMYCRWLRANGLMLRQRQYRPRTTDSRHHFHIYEDLLNTTPKFVAKACGQMAVANAIMMYNTARPHSALGMRTPFQVVTGISANPLLSPTRADLSRISLGGSSTPADSIPPSVFHS